MKPRFPNYEILENSREALVLRDLGPWDVFPSIEAAADVVAEFWAPLIQGRHLQFIGADESRTEIVLRDGKFSGFDFPGDMPPFFRKCRTDPL